MTKSSFALLGGLATTGFLLFLLYSAPVDGTEKFFRRLRVAIQKTRSH
jgi:hypothetical protein